MPRVRCPKCATVVEVAPGESPVCPSCGFGRPVGTPPPPPTPTPPAPVSGPATDPSPAPLAGPAPDPWGAPAHGYGAPTAPGAAGLATPHEGGPPGKLREPGIIVLLYIVTFGIYGLVWHWKTGEEVDRFRPETRASGVMKAHVWTAVAGIALMLIALAMVGGALFSALAESAMQDREPTEDEVFDAVVGASFGFLLLLLAGAAYVASEVLKIVGLWRVWNMTVDQQRRIGVEPINPVLLLLFLLSPIIVGVVGIPLGFIPFLGAALDFLLNIGVIVVLILAYVWTQGALNQVWRAHGA